MSEYEIRIQKYNNLISDKKDLFKNKFESTFESNLFSKIKNGDNVRFAGRIINKRNFGNMIFLVLYDANGSVQVSLGKNELVNNYEGDSDFSIFKRHLDIGDIIGVSGDIYFTKTGEKTIRVYKVTFLGKSFRPLPEKFHGIENHKIKCKQRYLDIISSEYSREVFKVRSKFLYEIRNLLNDNSFMEVETPILISGNNDVEAFKTHHSGLDIDLFLRDSSEMFLRSVVISGFNKVFEIGKNFRNDCNESNKLQEFTTAQLCVAYWNIEDSLKFTKKFIKSLLNQTIGNTRFIYRGRIIDFSGEWNLLDYVQEISKLIKQDILKIKNVSELEEICLKYELLNFEDVNKSDTLFTLIDLLYLRRIKPKIIQPTIVYNYSILVLPVKDKSENSISMNAFQLVVMGEKILDSNGEVLDLNIHKNDFLNRSEKIWKNDECSKENDIYTKAKEYGIPPMSYMSLDVDRTIALICNKQNLNDVILFPIVR